MKSPIPPAALAQHIIALGKTGSGKSSKLRVLVEGLLEEEKPVCIIDPKGDWWGLKSSADGKRSGYPIVIFGGEHADVPLNAHAGAHVAELVATGNRSCLIDLGGWMVGERTRFFIDFAAALFKLSRGARHLVIDEVHNFAPQGKILDPDAGKMLHWANRLASEGRGKGLTIVAASQRPQKVHKDFLTSCETLIACKVIHKLDRDAIKDWIDGCADPAKGREVIASLAQLKKPEAWCWSPEIDFGPELVTFPMFKTYDSFKPQPADAGKLAGWATVDLDQVKAKLATVVEEAKKNDPAELRRRIAELERDLRTVKGAKAGTSDDELRSAVRIAKEDGFLSGALTARQSMGKELLALTHSMRNNLQVIMSGVETVEGIARATDAPKPAALPQNPRRIPHPEPPRAAPAARNGAGPSGGGSLSKAERSILAALAQHDGGAAKSKVAILAGYAVSGGGFNNALSSLRSKGYISAGDPIQATTEGLAAVGDVDPLPQGSELLDHWLRQLGRAEGAALSALYEAYPNAMDKESLAAKAGYEASGGGFNNALSRLRTLELIERRELRASEVFFS